jgi:hypothetical protein
MNYLWVTGFLTVIRIRNENDFCLDFEIVNSVNFPKFGSEYSPLSLSISQSLAR